MDVSQIRIGTRGSPLALAQTNLVIQALKNTYVQLKAKGAIKMVVITTTGDRVQNRLLAELGGKGLFTKELDEAILDNRIDIAIHSMKDIPTFLPIGIALHAVMPREDTRDAFICFKAPSLDSLPPESSVGTTSLRRKSQILNQRPDLNITPIRGNVDTRINIIKQGKLDATLLAYAGLKRLGKEELIAEIIDADVLLPAVGQGSLAATCRDDHSQANTVLAGLSEPVATAAVIAERAMLTVLEGSCNTPIGGLAEPDGLGNLNLRGLILSPDGQKKAEVSMAGPITEANDLGKLAGDNLLEKAGLEILRSIEKSRPIFIRPHPEAE